MIEYAFLAWNYVVQRNKIINLVGKNFLSLGENKRELLDFIESFNPDIISMEEFPEMFMDDMITRELYAPDRTYKIVETTHDSSFNPDHKRWMPDEFVFVSAYNIMKYKHLSVPMRVIEYPVNVKLDKPEKKVKLYLDVCIVGLWTPRKNQAYAIEIAKQLLNYNVRFHFVGNQAGNFEHYWKPLMDSLPENCIVHGELNNVANFVNICDSFLFTSKGDRNNKELNPIAIKEAMEHPTMPKFLFNLDVYLGKYNDRDDVVYLTGDIDTDSIKMRDVLNLTEKRKELVVIGTYPNTYDREVLTEECIRSHRDLGRDILLVSHYPVNHEIQDMVDYYIYDQHNPMIEHSYYNRFNQRTAEYSVEMRIEGDRNQSLCVLTNIMNAYKFAKAHGYTHMFYNTFDVILDPRDVEVVNNAFAFLGDEWKAYLATLDTPFGLGIQTNGMVLDVDIIPKFIDDVRTREEYNNACSSIGAQNFLEDYLMKRAQRTQGLWLDLAYEGTLLKNSGLGKSSNSEYYGILENELTGKKYFFFHTYNEEDTRIIKIQEEDDSIWNVYNLEESKTILLMLNSNTINVYMHTENGQEHLDTNKPVGTILLREGEIKQPKIKLVHIQTTLDDEREQQSRDSLQRVRDYGWEYVLHRNAPYKSLPPKHNCHRPDCVSMELFDPETVERLGTALTPAHYGCYQAFRDAILSEFDGCDYLMICEGDCLIEVDVAEFIHKVEECALMLDKHDIKIMSFGDKDTLEYGWPQSPVIKEVNEDMYVTDHIIGLQCIMFPSSISTHLKEVVRTVNWDAADMYFNIIFGGATKGIVHKRLTTQADGYSLIDKQFKTFRK